MPSYDVPAPVAAVVPSQQATLSDKLVHLGAYAAQNSAVAAAPLMNLIDPNINTMGAGGPAVNLLAMGLSGVAQPIKMIKRFDQDRYLAWVLLFLAVGIALLLWHDNLEKAVLNGLGALYTALENYGHLKPLGVLPPGTATPRDVELASAINVPPAVVAAST